MGLHDLTCLSVATGNCTDIDRNNVPAARENGLVRDLNLTGSEYPTLLSLLYVGYILVGLLRASASWWQKVY